MESLKIELMIDGLRKRNVSLLTFGDISRIFMKDRRLVKDAVRRLVKAGIIKVIEKGKYEFLLSAAKPDDYQIANFIYQPSYVSLETALSFYGVIDQFVYQMISVTPKKTIVKVYGQKTFSYSHIEASLFSDYVLNDNYLIASRNKAIFDYLYLALKGFRSRENVGLIKIKKSEKGVFLGYVSNTLNYHDEKFIQFAKNSL